MKIRTSIFAKTTAIFFVSMAIVVAVSLTVISSYEGRAMKRRFEARNELISFEMADVIRSLIDNDTANTMFEVLKNKYKSDKNFVAYIKIIGGDYRFLLSTDSNEELGYSADVRDSILVRQILGDEQRLSSAEARYDGRSVHDVGVAIRSSSYGSYVLKVGYFFPKDAMIRYIWLLGLTMSLLSLSFFYAFTRRVIGALQRLREDAERIAKGDVEQEISGVARTDEIGDLARSFQTMLEEIRRRQQELALSERLAIVGRGTWRIAHNISNLLNPMHAFVTTLRERITASGGSDPDAESTIDAMDHHLELVRRDIQRMRRAIPDEPRLEPYTLGALIDVALERVHKPRDVEVRKCYQETGVAEVDPEQMADVFSNVVQNAYDAMRERGGVLSIHVGARGDHQVVASFEDTGPGIPEEKLEGLFDFFVTDKQRGMGIGLASASEVVRRHGGTMEVEGRPGEGAVFRILLPTE